MTIHSREHLAIDMSELFLAGAKELPLVAELEKKTFFEPWSEHALELFLTDGAFLVVCFEDGSLASYCSVTHVLDEAQIINVATDPAFKRRGCARRVLKRVFEECAARSINSISLEVRESNSAAISLYTQLGFTTAGIRRDFYKNPRENALVMIKNID